VGIFQDSLPSRVGKRTAISIGLEGGGVCEWRGEREDLGKVERQGKVKLPWMVKKSDTVQYIGDFEEGAHD